MTISRSIFFSVVLLAAGCNSFSLHSSRPFSLNRQTGVHRSSSLKSSGMEQIEFKIFPDGRVEELVKGIKGTNCNKVTEEINSKLGKVIASSPTEEMYEQELVLDQKVEQKASSSESSGWSGSSW